MEFSEAARAQTVSKGDLIGRYNALLKNNTATVINAEVKNFRDHPTLVAVTPLQHYAQDLVNWEKTGGNAVMARVRDAKAAKDAAAQRITTAGQNTDMRKYGKFIYAYKNGILKIVSKYGKVNDPVIVPMTVLYQGPLL
jgi:ABC-type transporter MlaC component